MRGLKQNRVRILVAALVVAVGLPAVPLSDGGAFLSEHVGDVPKTDDVSRLPPAAVRRCWLAGHLARELGTATVSRVTFVKRNPRHLHVVWSTGMNVFVNRGTNDWACATGDGGLGTVVLPRYGFVAFNARMDRYAAIRRRGGQVVEESAYSVGRRVVRYVNSRRPPKPVDYGWIQTAEAFRLVTEPGKPDVKTPLP